MLQVQRIILDFALQNLFLKSCGERLRKFMMSITVSLPGGSNSRAETGGNYFDRVIKGPICEELFFRYALQELLFKQFPKKILQKYSPQNISWVDCRAAQVARVILSSTLFSLCHGGYKNNCSAMNNVFIGGIIFGILQEKTGNIFASSLLHITTNFMANYFN